MNLNVLAVLVFGLIVILRIFALLTHRDQGIGINTMRSIGLTVLCTLATALAFAEVPANKDVLALFRTIAACLFGYVTQSLVIMAKSKVS